MTDESIRIRAKCLKTLFTTKGFVVAEMVTDHPFEEKPLRYIFNGTKYPLREGATYSMLGNAKRHEEHGLQFHISEFKTESDLITALLNGEIPSIGKETAKRIWDLHGWDIEKDASVESLSTLTGLGKKRAFAIMANIKSFKEGLAK